MSGDDWSTLLACIALFLLGMYLGIIITRYVYEH